MGKQGKMARGLIVLVSEALPCARYVRANSALVGIPVHPWEFGAVKRELIEHKMTRIKNRATARFFTNPLSNCRLQGLVIFGPNKINHLRSLMH